MKDFQMRLYFCSTLAFVAALVDQDTVLIVDPPHIAVQPGQDVALRCYHYPADIAADNTLDWYMPGGTEPIPELIKNKTETGDISGIVRFNGTNKGYLNIENATFDDAGIYTCRNANDTLNKESIVKVFEMPTYTTEISIVVGINIVLVVCFLACYMWDFIKSRRAQKTSKQKRNSRPKGTRK